MQFYPEVINIDNVSIDVKNRKIHFEERECGMVFTLAEQLLNAAYKNKLFLLDDSIQKDTPLYLSGRKILCRKTNMGNFYMDILLYNSALGTFKNGIYNRSLGHVNDLHEIELHQVIKGKVLIYIQDGKYEYWQIFREKDFFEIPSNSYHCTYVLEDSTIVANIYTNVFWEHEYSRKPYFSRYNPYSVVCTEFPEKYLVYKFKKKYFVIEQNCCKSGCLQYSDIPTSKFKLNKLCDNKKTIFEIFNRLE